MVKKFKCKKCKKHYKKTTKEELCAFCYKEEFGTWSLEFSNYDKDKHGNLISKEKPMRFRKKTKTKKKK